MQSRVYISASTYINSNCNEEFPSLSTSPAHSSMAPVHFEQDGTPLKFRPQDLHHVMRSLPPTRNLLGRLDDLIDFHGIPRLLLTMLVPT